MDMASVLKLVLKAFYLDTGGSFGGVCKPDMIIYSIMFPAWKITWKIKEKQKSLFIQ